MMMFFNVVMFRVKHKCARAHWDEWSGLGRIIVIDGKGVWLQSCGQPIASATHMLRPCSTPELLAWQVRSRSKQPTAAPLAAAEDAQDGFLDMREDAEEVAQPEAP